MSSRTTSRRDVVFGISVAFAGIFAGAVVWIVATRL